MTIIHHDNGSTHLNLFHCSMWPLLFFGDRKMWHIHKLVVVRICSRRRSYFHFGILVVFFNLVMQLCCLSNLSTDHSFYFNVNTADKHLTFVTHMWLAPPQRLSFHLVCLCLSVCLSVRLWTRYIETRDQNILSQYKSMRNMVRRETRKLPYISWNSQLLHCNVKRTPKYSGNT